MKTHEMGLGEAPFGRISRGEKTIEVRLNDEKRRQVALGDQITFHLDTPAGRTNDTLRVEVLEILHASSFRELAALVPVSCFGYPTIEGAAANFESYYPPEEQLELGVVGFRIRKLD